MFHFDYLVNIDFIEFLIYEVEKLNYITLNLGFICLTNGNLYKRPNSDKYEQSPGFYKLTAPLLFLLSISPR